MNTLLITSSADDYKTLEFFALPNQAAGRGLILATHLKRKFEMSDARNE